MKTNKEISIEGMQLFRNIQTGEMDKKEVNKYLKEASTLLKKKNAALKNFKKWGAIAKKRKELHTFPINEDSNIYAVPMDSKSFYGFSEGEPVEVITNGGIDYLVIFNNGEF